MGALAIEAYFFQNWFLAKEYVDRCSIIADELNVTAKAEPYYAFALNVQRELINDATLPILNRASLSVAKETLENFYGLNKQILDNNF